MFLLYFNQTLEDIEALFFTIYNTSHHFYDNKVWIQSTQTLEITTSLDTAE